MIQQRVGEISSFSSSTHQTLQPHRIDCPGGKEEKMAHNLKHHSIMLL